MALLLAATPTPTDPNWLPSTLAQATAALVAIVGGFLVTRLLTLSAAKNGLEQRDDQLESQLRIAQAELVSVRRAMLEVAFRWFKTEHLHELVQRRGVIDTTDFLSRHRYRGVSIAAMRGKVEPLLENLREASARMDAAYPSTFPPREVSELAQQIGGIAESEREVHAAIAKSMIDGAGYIVTERIRAGAPRSDAADREQDGRHQTARELESRIRALRAERELVADQLTLRGQADGIGRGIALLGLFGLLGVIFPMVVMACQPVPNSTAIRVLMVVAFGVGFAALIAYLGIYLLRLAPRLSQVPGEVKS